MAIEKSKLTSILLQNFPNAKIIVNDLIGDREHYSLHITCKSFKGLSLITQHRMVKNSLSNVLNNELHAITIKTSSS